MTITREHFLAATGREPELDDLERCNCQQVGEFGHYACGWCDDCNLPRFACGHLPHLVAVDDNFFGVSRRRVYRVEPIESTKERHDPERFSDQKKEEAYVVEECFGIRNRYRLGGELAAEWLSLVSASPRLPIPVEWESVYWSIAEVSRAEGDLCIFAAPHENHLLRLFGREGWRSKRFRCHARIWLDVVQIRSTADRRSG